MESPAAPEPAPPLETERPRINRVLAHLDPILKMALAGELQGVMVGYMRVDGAATVSSSPMSPIMLNHMLKLFERRVNREYDRAVQGEQQAHSPTNPMRSNSPKPVLEQLPRKERRQVQAAQRRMVKKSLKEALKAKANGVSLPRKTP